MTPPKGTCTYCKEQVEASDAAAYGVKGAEVERSGGGANYIAHKRRINGMIWHSRFKGDCLDKQFNGDQRSLL